MLNKTSGKQRRLVTWLVAGALGMFGFGFALVPIYNVLCKVTGLNGKTSGPVAEVSEAIDYNRTVTVQFLATANANLPWDFYPMQKSIKLHPGEKVRVAYYARNNLATPLTVQAIPSVTPGLAASHLKKTECFCFKQQTFQAHEARVMPVLFHLDQELPKEMTTITLSYTLFDASKVAVSKPEKALGKIGG